MNTIYTAGYAGWTPDALRAAAWEVGAMLFDIRMNPTSTRAEWRKAALRQTFGSGYLHMPALGNRNYHGGPIALAAPERALSIAQAHLERTPIILLCACREWRSCHRRDAADYLARHLGASVEHLEPPVRVSPPGMLKALTVRQPWAWAIFAGKNIENRNWLTRYRGRLAIHAAKGMTRMEYESAARFCTMRGLVVPPRDALAFGAILGTVEVVDCVSLHPSPWFEGEYGLVLSHPQPFARPVPAVGALSLWEWDAHGWSEQ